MSSGIQDYVKFQVDWKIDRKIEFCSLSKLKPWKNILIIYYKRFGPSTSSDMNLVFEEDTEDQVLLPQILLLRTQIEEIPATSIVYTIFKRSLKKLILLSINW